MLLSRFYCLLAGLLLCFQVAEAQEWVRKMKDPGKDFYEVQREFNAYWQGKTIEKGSGYKPFKRYEYLMEPRVYPSGDRSLPAQTHANYQQYVAAAAKQGAQSRGYGSSWSALGPFAVPANGVMTNGDPMHGGAGRINFVRFDPAALGFATTFWVGSPGGGLWKTTNSGASWTCNTDNLASLGVSDLAIDPNNTNIMYLATGDGEVGLNDSRGVLKSTNGGTSWNATGLSWQVGQRVLIRKLLMHPDSSNVLFAATNVGIYRTRNSGALWMQVSTVPVSDLEFKPGMPSTIYAAGTTFLRSINSGGTFVAVTSGVPTSCNRFALGVTPANSNYVYLLASDSTTSNFKGLCRSDDSGSNFSVRSSSPNLLGQAADGSSPLGQGWYDLALAVSPTNAEQLFIGGVNIWQSDTGGSSWVLNAFCGYGTSTKPYVHSDIHALEWLPGSSILFAATDGGLFKTTNTGTTWTDESTNLSIGEIYCIGQSAGNAGLLLSGWQDNGTNKMSGTAWSAVQHSDGTECFIDRTNDNIVYSSTQKGVLYRSNNGGTNWTGITPAGVPEGAWVTPWCQDPNAANTIYSAYKQVYKSTDNGDHWTQISSFTGTNYKFVVLAVAPSNSNVMYVSSGADLFKTTNGGGIWTNIAGALPVAANALTGIAIHPEDPGKIWVTFSGYTAANKVFYSDNAGSTWGSLSTGLPNLPVNCIVFEKDSPGRIFIGTDVGVYTRDDLQPAWSAFFTNLPNVIVFELEIFYPTRKIRAATRGRGLWESSLPPASPLTANFTVSDQSICKGSTVTYYDRSYGGAVYRAWTFPGGSPNTTNALNPTVTYATPGTYNATLSVSQTLNGVSDTETKTNYLNVQQLAANFMVDNQQACMKQALNFSITDDAGCPNSWSWSFPGGTPSTSSGLNPVVTYAVPGSYSVTLTVHWSNGASATQTKQNYVTVVPITAALSSDIQQGCASQNIQFTDYSTGCPTAWSWSFPGGIPSTSSQKNPVVYYPVPGTYNVTLTSTKGSYSNTVVRNSYIGISQPIPAFTVSRQAICTGQTVTFTDQSYGCTSAWNWSFPGGTPATSTLQNPTVTYSTAGTYNVRLDAFDAGGNSNYELKTGYVSVLGSTSLSSTLSEGFQSNTFPSANWLVKNSDNDQTWTRTTAAGGFGSSSASAVMDNFNSAAGRKDQLQLPRLTFPAQTTIAALTFDVAYSRYSSTMYDSLAILVSADCGLTYQRVYYKGSSNLSTTGTYSTTPFVPTAAQWRTETVYLNSFTTSSSLIVLFENRSGSGNNIYLDNILITTKPPVAAFTATTRTLCAGSTTTFSDLSTGAPTSRSWSFPGGTPATSTAAFPVVTYPTAGNYSVTLVSTNSAGSNTHTESAYITVPSTHTLPFSQDFQASAFAPSKWSIYNPDNDATWTRQSGAGGFTTGSAAYCARFDNYNATVAGKRDQLRTGVLNLSTLPTAVLQFDVAYSRYNASRSDTLSVLVSTNCGQSFTRLYYKGGSTLSTTGTDQTTSFSPTATQWRKETVSLSAYAGNSSVVIAFENRSGNGNDLYVDNIKLVQPPVAAFSVNASSSPVNCVNQNITFTSQSTNSPTGYSWTFPGGTPATSTAASPTVKYLNGGVYDVTLTVTNAAGTSTLTKPGYAVISAPLAGTLSENFFGSAFAPAGWNLLNPHNDATWTRSATAGAFGSNSGSAFFDNFASDTRGKPDRLQTGSLSVIPSKLVFDVAYARYSASNTDTLAVYVSTDCGKTFTQLYLKSGNTLSTTGGADITAAFVPTAAQWRTETVDLSAYTTAASLIIAFENRGGYGNNLYLDNVQLASPPQALFTASQTQLCGGGNVTYTSQSTGTPTSYSWTFPGGTPASSTAASPVIAYSTAGTYNVTLAVTNAAGTSTLSKYSYLISSTALPLPLAEGFEGATFAPVKWNVLNPDNSTAWMRTPTVSGFGTGTACAFFNNLAGDHTGERDQLRTGGLSLTGLSAATLKFDVAYARHSGLRSDTLSVLVSTNCGQSFTRVYYKGGSTLSTTGADQTSFFTPTAAQWRTESISLGAYTSFSNVIVVFENRSGSGNALYLDNIRLDTPPLVSFTSNVVSTCPGGSVNYTAQVTGTVNSYSWTFPGGTPATSAAQNPTVVYNTGGLYNVTLAATNANGTGTKTIAGYMNVSAPVTGVTANPTTVTLGGSSTLSVTQPAANMTYAWSGQGLGSTSGANVTATPPAAGTYTYTLTATNMYTGCVSTATVQVTASGTCTAPTLPSVTTGYICAASGTATLTASGGGTGVSTYNWYATSSAATSPSPFFTGTAYTTPVLTASKTYYVTASAGTNCESARKAVAANVTPPFTVSVSPPSASITAGSSVALSASASTTGVSYSWSPAAGLSSTSGATVTATPAATTTYTLTGTRSTCTSTATVTVTVTVTCPAPLSGAYTINKNLAASATNFTSFTSFAGKLNFCGVSGPVTVSVTAGTGPYTEQVEFVQISGASATNTITLNGNGNTLQFAPVSPVFHVLRFNGTDYFRLNNLVINPTAASIGWGIHLFNLAEHNIISSCTLNLSTTATGSGLNGIVASASTTGPTGAGANVSELQLLNNTINGGYYGITLHGLATAKAAGIILSGNTLANAYQNGMYLVNLDAAQVTGSNVVMRTGNLASYGIYLSSIDNGFTLTKNKVRSFGRYGVYLLGCNSTAVAARAQVSNNMIGGGVQSAGTATYGLYLSNADRLDIWHNSVSLDNGAAGSAALYALSSSTGLDVRNNSLAYQSTSASYALSSPAASLSTLDYNNYYSMGTQFVNLGGDQANLAALQAAAGPAGHDGHSYQGLPAYASASDLHAPGSGQLSNRGVAIAAVTTDIDGQVRTATPDLGADEFITPVARWQAEDVALKVDVYPNPFTAELNIRLVGVDQQPIGLTITDVLGRVIEKRSVAPGNCTLGTSALSPGLYLLIVQQGETRLLTKVVKTL